ncbi:MAG: hypothetical protein JW863_15905 [Chitinispirillaceae bacterium]|nr:hypothetical protein [Chitinispirillaceae bacterium]
MSEAVRASGKRLIVFEVGGVISGDLTISNGDVTVAGHTAPYPGITIIRGTVDISANNVVISHIAVRVGDATGEADGIVIYSTNVVLDHVISTWGVDETLTLKGSDNVTLYKCVIAEALSHSVHEEGEHSKGNLIFRICDPVSIIGCLYAHNRMRNPRISDSRVVMVNSIVYDPATGKDDDNGGHNYFVHLGDNGEQPNIPEVSFVGNVGLHGPDTDVKAQYLLNGHKDEKGKAYMKDNIIQDRDGKNLTIADGGIIPLDEPPLWPDGLETIPAHESIYEVLRTVGPQPGRRESVTKRVVTTVADGTGGIINSQNEVGGYPNYNATKRALTVPNGAEARRAWLDSIENSIAVDKEIDLSRLYSRIGSKDSDKLSDRVNASSGRKRKNPAIKINQAYSNRQHLITSLTLPAPSSVGMTLFDLSGKNVAALRAQKLLPAGTHDLKVDIHHLPAGSYMFRFKIGSTVQSLFYIHDI